MTFTLEEFGRLYIREIVRLHGGNSIYCIGSGSQVYNLILGEFLASHGDTIDDEHYFSSLDGRSIREDHPGIRRHATGMRP